jgi:tellurite resistance protein
VASTRVRITPNLFGIAFGLAGLAGAWQVAYTRRWVPAWPVAVLYGSATLAWVVLCAAWVIQFRPGRLSLSEELRHPVFGPFVSLVPIVGMLLAEALAAVSRPPGVVLVVVFAVATLLVGGWMTAGWVLAPLTVDTWHPGYFLPTVAGGLLASAGLAGVGQHTAAEAAFGIGVICWLTLGSIMLARLFLRPPLPEALVPTLAIEVAPPVVAGNAYLALNGGHLDALACVFAGYALLMVVVQVRLVSTYRVLSFGPGFWAFTFSYAAVATFALHWIALSRVAGSAVLADVVLGMITLFVGAIAVRTVIGLVRRDFLPRLPAP